MRLVPHTEGPKETQCLFEKYVTGRGFLYINKGITKRAG